MNKIVKEAIDESWRDYQDATINMDENEHWAHEHGWKEGYEWILTELKMNNEINDETYKKYLDGIYMNEISADVFEKYMKKLS